MTDRKTEFYAAWISSNGRSVYKKPRRLYKADWQEEEMAWDKSGNIDAPLGEGFSQNEEYGSFSYVSRDPEKVKLVIKTSITVFKGLCIAWGVRDDD